MDIERAAKEALKRPDSFYTSDERIGTTHGFTIGVHRDSDILDQSNWEVISGDMLNRFGHGDDPDVFVHRSTHWAHGWSEELAVRVYARKKYHGAKIISRAFAEILAWKDALENYPVADEQHYSEMEHADAIETLENSYNVSKEKSGEAFSWLFDTYSYCSAEEYNENVVVEAIVAVGDDCQDCGDYKAKRIYTRKLTNGTQKEALCVSCYIEATRKR